jgi:acetylornithine deacetylase/succinyl-diaminopimelate desuccinylase family protein
MDRAALGTQLAALLGDLVAIPSTYPPGDTSRICGYCRDFLSSLGFRCEIHEREKGVQNLMARLGSGKPSIVFNAHADTVGIGERAAWRTDPLKLSIAEGRAYGLGAANCKASMAIHLWLAREVSRLGGPKRGELVFTFAGDEENLGPNGLAAIRQEGLVKPDVLIVAAPTRNRLVVEERGVMWVKVTVRGRAAHAGAPHAGESAIFKTTRLVERMRTELLRRIGRRRSKSGQQATLSIGTIRGGENINVVPDLCTIQMDRRMLPEEKFDAVFKELKQFVVKSEKSARVELLTGTPGFRALEDGAAVKAFSRAIRTVTGKAPKRLNVIGASDGRYFARDGIEILVTGPGDGADSHIPNEFVPLEDLIEAALIHLDAAKTLLKL